MLLCSNCAQEISNTNFLEHKCIRRRSAMVDIPMSKGAFAHQLAELIEEHRQTLTSVPVISNKNLSVEILDTERFARWLREYK